MADTDKIQKEGLPGDKMLKDAKEDSISVDKYKEQRDKPLAPQELKVIKQARLFKAMIDQGFSKEKIEEYFAQKIAEKNLDQFIGKKATIISIEKPFGTLGEEYAMETGEITGYSDFNGELTMTLDEPLCERGDRGNKSYADAVSVSVENLKFQE